MKPLSFHRLKKFLKLAGDHLSGDWVLLGGTVLPLLGARTRPTTDIDLSSLSEPSTRQTIQLMELAETLQLPPESINQAAGYFLKKIPSYTQHLILLHQGKSAKFYRPDLELFLRLKISRLSESDLDDCLEYLKIKRDSEEPAPNWVRIAKLIEAEMERSPPEKLKRLKILLNQVRVKA